MSHAFVGILLIITSNFPTVALSMLITKLMLFLIAKAKSLFAFSVE
jgi:hypothetical protein